jgi:hypothetical protein
MAQETSMTDIERIAALEATIARLTADLAEAREHVRTYGRHFRNCRLITNVKCTCGLIAARAKAKEQHDHRP